MSLSLRSFSASVFIALGCSAGTESDDPSSGGVSSGSGGVSSGSGGVSSGSGGVPAGGGGVSSGSGGVSSGSGGVSSGSGGGAGSSSAGSSTGGSGGSTSDCSNVLEVTYRDFSEAHPDFEMTFSGDVVRLQLVEPRLGSDRKPVFMSSIGCAPAGSDPTTCHASYFPDQPVITGADTFSQWYRTQPGINFELRRTLELTDNGAGQYVYASGMFFPLGTDEGFGVTPANNVRMTNFLFTTEIHATFTYRAGQTMTFRGDDDVWIFVNGILALDLGGLHPAAESSIDFDAQADRLGIVPGASYPIDFFHAERHTIDSQFRLQTNISCFVPDPIE